jgi:hypothetical protein
MPGRRRDHPHRVAQGEPDPPLAIIDSHHTRHERLTLRHLHEKLPVRLGALHLLDEKGDRILTRHISQEGAEEVDSILFFPVEEKFLAPSADLLISIAG